MRNLISVLAVALAFAGAAEAAPKKTCAQIQAYTQEFGAALYLINRKYYTHVYAHAAYCRKGETVRRLLTPAIDTPHCFAGYRCLNAQGVDRYREEAPLRCKDGALQHFMVGSGDKVQWVVHECKDGIWEIKK